MRSIYVGPGPYVLGMGGLGDCIYQRPFVRALASRFARMWLRTPWPQLYADLPNVQPVKWDGLALRTQAANQDGWGGEWAKRPPRSVPRIFLRYGFQWPDVPLMDELAASVGLGPDDVADLTFDLPDLGPSPVQADRPVAVIRPVTLRREWRNAARNPDPTYIVLAAQILRRAGYHVVSVADVDGEAEWFVGEPPEAGTTLHAGELNVAELLALVAHADVAVGGVGWIVPAAIASGTPLVAVGGGQGATNAMEAVTDARLMATDRAHFIEPDDFCRCDAADHADCPKTIADFPARFRGALDAVAAPMGVAA